MQYFRSDMLNAEKVQEFIAFIQERENVRIRKEGGQPRPWTSDPILNEYKFCNVHREDDKTTRWVAQNWRTPHAADPDLWFALVIARRALNWPGSMEALGYPVPWNPDHFLKVTSHLEEIGAKTYDTAYQLLVQGQKGNKAEMMIKHILNPLWVSRDYIRPRPGDTLGFFFRRLSSFKYMGSFYTGQVIADLKYVQLLDADDWSSFAVPGPGSERGLNRVCGRDKNTPWKEEDWYATLMDLHKRVNPIFPMPGMEIHAQDLQNCLCEFDKYERAWGKEGKVRPYRQS